MSTLGWISFPIWGMALSGTEAGILEGAGSAWGRLTSSDFTGLAVTVFLVFRPREGWHTSFDFGIKRMRRTFHLVIMLTSVNDGPLSPANKLHSIFRKMKWFVQAVLMLLKVGSQPRRTIVSAPMQEYFWHFPSSWRQPLYCDVIQATAAASFFTLPRSFVWHLLFVVVSPRIPFSLGHDWTVQNKLSIFTDFHYIA